jgi:uncharacterized protein
VHCDCRYIYGGGYSALTMASRHASEDAVRLVLDAGANVDAPSNDGTALMLATERRKWDVVELLLAKGADPNKARDAYTGKTALMAAAGLHAGIVQALLSAGANVNARGKNGATALINAAEANHPDSLKMLLDAGAQLESKATRGRTPLMIAVMNGSVDAARFLVQRGARIDVADEDNRSIVSHARALNADTRARMLALLEQKDSE